jgi:hypothetical protein
MVCIHGLRYATSMAKIYILLGEVAERGATTIDIKCRRCDRHGRLNMARLLQEYGPQSPVWVIMEAQIGDAPGEKRITPPSGAASSGLGGKPPIDDCTRRDGAALHRQLTDQYIVPAMKRYIWMSTTSWRYQVGEHQTFAMARRTKFGSGPQSRKSLIIALAGTSYHLAPTCT